MHLEHCPFCGGIPELETEKFCFGHGDFGSLIFVKCLSCGASGPRHDDYCDNFDAQKNRAINTWNQRLSDVT